jgi:thiol-disulfide isomerase/thioredoxin
VTVPPRAALGLPVSGRPAPGLTLPPVEGGAAWTLADHLDPTGESCPDAVLLAFMASWCTYCTQSLPSLVELQEQYPELEIVTVTVDTTPDAQRTELAKVRAAGLTGPVLAADGPAVDAWLGGGKSVPKYYFVNRVGTITAKDDGFGDKVKPMLARQAERALGG